MPVDPDAVDLDELAVGEQFLMYGKVIARTGTLLTLDLHESGFTKNRGGQIRLTLSGSSPFAVVGEIDGLGGGHTPDDFRVERVVFDVDVGDQVVTTDGVHYVVQVVGSGDNGLPEEWWSPSTALNPRFRYADIFSNLGP